MYIRKTKDIYSVEVDYGEGYGYESVYDAGDKKTAKQIYNDYVKNDTYMRSIRIKKHRVKI